MSPRTWHTRHDGSLLVNADRTGTLRLELSPAIHPDTYFGFVARVVPEEHHAAAEDHGAPRRRRLERARRHVKKGETVGSILRELGAAPDEIKAIIAVTRTGRADGGLKEGQKLRILWRQPRLGRMQPLRVIVVGDSGIDAVVALSDMGKYVSVDVASMNRWSPSRPTTKTTTTASGMRLYQSIYETALRNKIPKPRDRRADPHLLLRRRFPAQGAARRLLRRALRRTTRRPATPSRSAVRRRSPSAARPRNTTASRPPTTASSTTTTRPARARRSSWCASRSPSASCARGFGARNHPLLGYFKMHTGVDWAAPLGTPIYASGNGTIEKVGWEGGYGKYVRIKHANGYETAYGHMTAFARLEAGRARPPGPGDRLCRLDRPLDRPARALRDPRQRPLRRSAARQAAARPRARRRRPRRLREGARPLDAVHRRTRRAHGAMHSR